MAKTCFPLLEQMLAEQAERERTSLGHLHERLELSRAQEMHAWEVARSKESDCRALERAISSNVAERVRDELASGAAIALSKSIQSAMLARTAEDPTLLNVVIPIDLRDTTSGTIENDIVSEYLAHIEATVSIDRRMPSPSDENVPVAAGYVEYLVIKIQPVECRRHIMHWPQPKRTS